jgi:glycosyltransferase involved in cell wall biosynthesis
LRAATHRLRIAQVAPLYESVPPARYGGTERVVSYLTEELVSRGHDVTLFASGDSRTRARLVPGVPRALRLDAGCRDPLARHLLLLERVFEAAESFDLIHFHVDYLHFPLSRRMQTPQMTTLHGRLDLPDLVPLYREFSEMPLVSISNAQRVPIPGAGWIGTVPHGLPPASLRFGEGRGGYFAFLGRIAREKRLDRAIEIARRAGRRLLVAAKIDPADAEYHEREIAPLLTDPHVTFLGEIGEEDKSAFLGEAEALLFPIDWPEPFGLVMIESLACGTPVIAYRGGSVEEVLEDGRTGFLVSSIAEAVDAVRRLPSIDRRQCREAFERRFTVERMAGDYERLYERIVQARGAGRPPQPPRLAAAPRVAEAV